MQVNLLEENSEGGVFRILPSYKVKSVGDEVDHMYKHNYYGIDDHKLQCTGAL